MKFEYHSEAISVESLNDRMNALGADGWRAAHVEREADGSYRIFFYKEAGMDQEDRAHMDEAVQAQMKAMFGASGLEQLLKQLIDKTHGGTGYAPH